MLAALGKLHDGMGSMARVCPGGCSQNRINTQPLTASKLQLRRWCEEGKKASKAVPWKLTVMQAN